MSKLSKTMKKLGFTFSFRRLKKAILLVILFTLIGTGVYLLYEFKTSETGLKMVYEKEISSLMDLEGKTLIRVHKKDINEDNKQDFVFIIGEEKRSSADVLNSTVERYLNVSFIIIDGETNEVITFDTKKAYEPEVTLRIVEDKKNRYYLISDYSGNIDLLKLKDGKMIDIIKNTTSHDLLGYTIYTNKNEEREEPNIIEVKLDNYDKKYLKEYTKTKKLDFTELGIDMSKYRETYLRDKISKVELKDTNEDGIVELITTQYILYNLDETLKENKTMGKVQIRFDILGNKLVYKELKIEI